jgi:hypothetical protein
LVAGRFRGHETVPGFFRGGAERHRIAGKPRDPGHHPGRMGHNGHELGLPRGVGGIVVARGGIGAGRRASPAPRRVDDGKDMVVRHLHLQVPVQFPLGLVEYVGYAVARLGYIAGEAGVEGRVPFVGRQQVP